MTDRRLDSVNFLHWLGYLYFRGGQRERGLAFLLLAAKIAPDDSAVLQTLASVFVDTDVGHRALAAIDRIELVEGELPQEIALLKSRALWLEGEHDLASKTFLDYVKGMQPL